MASINKVILMGNLTADPELKTTPSGVSVVSFSIGVQRKLSKEQQQDPNAVKSDFINIVAWRNTAEFISKYFSKGKSIVVIGQLQVRSYTAQDGSKRYVTEVVADEVSFGANASDGAVKGTAYNAEKRGDVGADDEKYVVGQADFVEVGAEDDLPF